MPVDQAAVGSSPTTHPNPSRSLPELYRLRFIGMRRVLREDCADADLLGLASRKARRLFGKILRLVFADSAWLDHPELASYRSCLQSIE